MGQHILCLSIPLPLWSCPDYLVLNACSILETSFAQIQFEIFEQYIEQRIPEGWEVGKTVYEIVELCQS